MAWYGDNEYIEISKNLVDEIRYDCERFKNANEWYNYMTDIFQSDFISWERLDDGGAIVTVEPKLTWNGDYYMQVPR